MTSLYTEHLSQEHYCTGINTAVNMGSKLDGTDELVSTDLETICHNDDTWTLKSFRDHACEEHNVGTQISTEAQVEKSQRIMNWLDNSSPQWTIPGHHGYLDHRQTDNSLVDSGGDQCMVGSPKGQDDAEGLVLPSGPCVLEETITPLGGPSSLSTRLTQHQDNIRRLEIIEWQLKIILDNIQRYYPPTDIRVQKRQTCNL